MLFSIPTVVWRGPCATTVTKLLHSQSPAYQIAPLHCHGAKVKPAPVCRLVMLRPQVTRSQRCPSGSTTPLASTSLKPWMTQIRPFWRAITSATATLVGRAQMRRMRTKMMMILMIWGMGELCSCFFFFLNKSALCSCSWTNLSSLTNI